VDVPSLLLSTRSGRTRVMVAAGIGVLAALVVAWFVPWQLTLLVAWDVTAALVVATVWLSIGHFSAEQTKELATKEDDSRTGTHLLLLGAALVSLVGVVLAFVKANAGTHRDEVLLESFGVATIVCSWLLVHTVFALRYAHVYYTEPEGGIDFKTQPRGTEDPDYLDFAYTAFTVGMTFQVSDTDITRREMRRQVLRHALISFLFGAVILATTVNVVASLLNA
jgi:uncharacterized membrane protein